MTTDACVPFKSETRFSRLSVKDQAPCMASFVTRATSSPQPAAKAMSSMHSFWVSVLSMSVAHTLKALIEKSAGTAMQST